MRSPCTSRMREAAKPPISACRTLAGSAPAFEANSSASPTASMFSATMIWLATLRGLAVAVAADQRDVLAHQLEQRLRPGRTPPRSPPTMMVSDRGLGADFAARNRRIEIVAAELVDAAARTPWSRSARSSSCRRRSCPCVRPSATPSVAEQHLARRPACRAPSVMMMSAPLRHFLRRSRTPCRPASMSVRGTPLRDGAANSVWPPLDAGGPPSACP